METKVLNIDTKGIEQKLTSLGAKKVFDNVRTITYFQNPKENQKPSLKLTEEEKLKLSYQNDQGDEEIKLFVSRKAECVALLGHLGYVPISEVKARRISYEWMGIDFDIGEFLQIPAFLEIDLGDSKFTLEDIFQKLDLEKNEKIQMSTPETFKKYKLDYFELFKI